MWGEEKMRRLVWFAIGFLVACVLGIYLLPHNLYLVFSVAAAVIGVLLFLVRRKYTLAAGIVLIGLSAAMLWMQIYETNYLSTVRKLDGKSVKASVEISDYGNPSQYGQSAQGVLKLKGKPYKVLMYIDETKLLKPGDRVTGSITLRLTTDGALQGATYHQGDGIFLLAYADDKMIIQKADVVPGKYFPALMARNIKNTIDRTFPSDASGFARALLLGDGSKLSYQEDTAYKVSGIRHIIAVSGLHVSILFSAAYALAGRKRYLTAIIGLPVLFLFSALAGFTPSVVRACIMQSLMIVAILLDREYDPPTALAAAVLVLLIANPMVITSISFQLSVGCVIGIFLFSKRIHDYLLRGKRKEYAKGKSIRARFIRWCVTSISITVSAMLTTTPLCAVYFGMVSLIGVVTNLAVLWLVSFVFIGILSACALGLIWNSCGCVLAWIVAWPIRLIQTTARFLASIPWAAVYTCSIYIVAWIAFTYILLLLLLLPGKRRPLQMLACSFVGLCIAIAASCMEPRLDNYRVTVLDVGQGQCVLVQHGERVYMVDCGGDNMVRTADLAAQTLLSQGIFEIDGLILTHYDLDHAGAAEMFLSRIPAKRLYLPDISDNNGIRQTLNQMYPERIRWIQEEKRIDNTDFSMTLYPATTTDKGNESCLGVLFRVEKCDILITGDMGTVAEKSLLDRADLPQLDLLVVGHHGSASSTSFALLSRTQPKAAAISVKENNRYGLPSDEVLFRLELFGVKVWRTDKQGTIIFRG